MTQSQEPYFACIIVCVRRLYKSVNSCNSVASARKCVCLCAHVWCRQRLVSRVFDFSSPPMFWVLFTCVQHLPVWIVYPAVLGTPCLCPCSGEFVERLLCQCCILGVKDSSSLFLAFYPIRGQLPENEVNHHLPYPCLVPSPSAPLLVVASFWPTSLAEAPYSIRGQPASWSPGKRLPPTLPSLSQHNFNSPSSPHYHILGRTSGRSPLPHQKPG